MDDDRGHDDSDGSQNVACQRLPLLPNLTTPQPRLYTTRYNAQFTSSDINLLVKFISPTLTSAQIPNAKLHFL